MAEPSEGTRSVSKPPSERSISAAVARPEHREHPRFKVEGAKLEVGKPGFLALLGLGRPPRLVNLSRGGIMFCARKRLEVGSRVPIRIEVEKYRETIESQGEIRWCAQSAKTPSDIYLGVAFVGIDAAERKKIAHMEELFTSAEYRARSNAIKEISSAFLKVPKFK